MSDNNYLRQSPVGPVPFAPMGSDDLYLLAEADKYNISHEQILGTKVIAFTYKGVTRYVRAQVPSSTHFIGYYGAHDKAEGKAFLTRAGIATPRSFLIRSADKEEQWLAIFDALEKPLVVKPTLGTQGQSVLMGIDSPEEFILAVKQCLAHSSAQNAAVLVEETFNGKEYRILATGEKVLGIVNRIPANVIGDGHSTLQQLIDQKNADPRRGDHAADVLVKIHIDEVVQTHLKKKQMTLQTVPAVDERVFLRQNSNISTGGDSIDVTDIAHPSVKEIAMKVMEAFPLLDFGGIDFMTTDITQAQTQNSYSIIEVNAGPGFSIHDHPYEGKNRHAVFELLCLLFPDLRSEFRE